MSTRKQREHRRLEKIEHMRMLHEAVVAEEQAKKPKKKTTKKKVD